MTDVIISSIDWAAALMFAGAVFYSIKNYRLTRKDSRLWLAFATANVIAMFWAAATALEWMGYRPGLMDVIQQPLLAAAISAFAICSIVCTFEFVQVRD